jgi:hypothetical protein
MDTKFRPLLPKPLSQARPEPFLISTASNQYASSHQETTGTSSAHALSAKAYSRVRALLKIIEFIFTYYLTASERI